MNKEYTQKMVQEELKKLGITNGVVHEEELGMYFKICYTRVGFLPTHYQYINVWLNLDLVYGDIRDTKKKVTVTNVSKEGITEYYKLLRKTEEYLVETGVKIGIFRQSI